MGLDPNGNVRSRQHIMHIGGLRDFILKDTMGPMTVYRQIVADSRICVYLGNEIGKESRLHFCRSRNVTRLNCDRLCEGTAVMAVWVFMSVFYRWGTFQGSRWKIPCLSTAIISVEMQKRGVKSIASCFSLLVVACYVSPCGRFETVGSMWSTRNTLVGVKTRKRSMFKVWLLKNKEKITASALILRFLF